MVIYFSNFTGNLFIKWLIIWTQCIKQIKIELLWWNRTGARIYAHLVFLLDPTVAIRQLCGIPTHREHSFKTMNLEPRCLIVQAIDRSAWLGVLITAKQHVPEPIITDGRSSSLEPNSSTLGLPTSPSIKIRTSFIPLTDNSSNL